MGLVLRISTQEQKGSFFVTDETGKHSPSNEGGYGYTTLPLANVTDAKLYITPPGSTTEFMIDAMRYGLPGIQKTMQVFPSMIGLQKMISGHYRARYTVSGTTLQGQPVSRQCTHSFLLVMEVECCVDKLLGRTVNTAPQNMFRDDDSLLAVRLSALLNRARHALRCGNLSGATAIYEYLIQQCTCC